MDNYETSNIRLAAFLISNGIRFLGKVRKISPTNKQQIVFKFGKDDNTDTIKKLEIQFVNDKDINKFITSYEALRTARIDSNTEE